MPSGACASKNARCSFENSLRRRVFPAIASRTAVGCSFPLNEPEQTKPPGIASTSTPKLGDFRSSAGSSSGTTGRSFTTESSPFPWIRRARTTTPVWLSARSGVSKKNTCRIWASSGSSSQRLRRPSVDPTSGTVSFSSTLSASRIRSSSSAELLVGESWWRGSCASHPCLLCRCFDPIALEAPSESSRSDDARQGILLVMASRDDEHRSGLADAAGRAAFFPARAAARVWRAPIEEAVDEVLSAPEIARVLDRALAGSLPEELARSLVRHRVLERIAAELAASGELERLVTAALASPRTLELTDRVLASDETQRALRHVASSPELRDAIARQTTGLAEEVVGGVRASAARLDDRAEQIVRRPPRAERPIYGGIATRAIALATDAAVTIVLFMSVVGIAALMASLVGGLRPAVARRRPARVRLDADRRARTSSSSGARRGRHRGCGCCACAFAAPRATPPRSVDRSCAWSGSCSRSCRCSPASSRCCSPSGDAGCRTSSREPSSSTTTPASRSRHDGRGDGRLGAAVESSRSDDARRRGQS